jgi:hypothetical protein
MQSRNFNAAEPQYRVEDFIGVSPEKRSATKTSPLTVLEPSGEVRAKMLTYSRCHAPLKQGVLGTYPIV